MNANPWYPVLAGIAIVVSVAALYLQHFHIRGPQVRVMEEIGKTRATGSVPQISTILPYDRLPVEIRNQYPDYREEGNCALMRIPVVNEGDRSGYMKVLRVKAEAGVFNRNELESIRFSFYTYLPVPAHSAGLHTILIRNLPKKDDRHGVLSIRVEYQLTAFSRWRKRLRLRDRDGIIQVELQPPNPEFNHPRSSS